MTESKNPRLSEEQVRRANEFWNMLPHCCGYPDCDGDLVAENHSEKCPLFNGRELTHIEFAALFKNATLEAAPAPEESRSVQKRKAAQRGEPMPTFVAPASQPVSAPAEKKEWITEGMASAVFRSGREWREALNELLASRIEAHIAAALGNSTCHQAMCRDEILWRASIELAEVRAAIKEIEQMPHTNFCSVFVSCRPYGAPSICDCYKSCRTHALQAREAELLARGGAKP